MKDTYMHELIGKYLAGEINREERKLVEEWIDASKKNIQEFEQHASVWENTTVKFRSAESEALFRSVLNRIDEHQEREIVANETQRNRGVQRYLLNAMKIAVSILLIGAIAYSINYFFSEKPATATKVANIEKSNPAGQKLKTFLPDGSEVWLNAESRLSYPEKFNGARREVILEGEAFFQVVRDEDMPFIVRTGKLTTTVLGTSFNIKAFDDEPATHVALKNGRVKVSIAHEEGVEERLLEPGEGLSYNQLKNEITVEDFDAKELLSWKDGIIVFRDADQDEIFSRLRRWYGVKIEVENTSAEKWTYKGTFENASLDNVLRGISFSQDFSYRFVNAKHVIIHFN